AMDADKMHEWLQGVKVHELGPGFLPYLSGYLAQFAKECREIVEDTFKGKLIYSAGDNTLGLIPAGVALECPWCLNRAFLGGWQPHEVLSRAPEVLRFRAGVGIVHYNEDLRFALIKARAAEHAARDRQGNAVELFVARRSGEHVPVFVPWSLMDRVIAMLLQP